MTLGQVRTDMHELVEQVEGSKEFAHFNTVNPEHYLVHIFSATGDLKNAELGYYGTKSDKITVFKTNPIVAMPEEEIFKEKGHLHKLDLTAVRLGLKEATGKAEQYKAESYPRHQTMRMISILQQAEMPLWNITIVTNTLHMINLKIDAMTGQLISRSMDSIMSLAKE
jgi:hypothetical protein